MAKEYIERGALIARLKASPLFTNYGMDGRFVLGGVVDLVEKQPTIDPDDLKPRGNWNMHDDEILGLSCECSACHIHTCGDSRYCPNCGAKMDGKETDNEGI